MCPILGHSVFEINGAAFLKTTLHSDGHGVVWTSPPYIFFHSHNNFCYLSGNDIPHVPSFSWMLTLHMRKESNLKLQVGSRMPFTQE